LRLHRKNQGRFRKLAQTGPAVPVIHLAWNTPDAPRVGVTGLARGDVRRCLVVCPASLKHQWAREIRKFSDHTVAVVSGRPAQRGALQETVGSPKLDELGRILEELCVDGGRTVAADDGAADGAAADGAATEDERVAPEALPLVVSALLIAAARAGDDAALVLRAHALSGAPGVPAELAGALLRDARGLVARTSVVS